MLKQLLIPGTSLRASEIALGAAPWGSTVALDHALQLYDAFRQAGGNVFDTAHNYAAWEKNGLGASERALGQIIQQRDDRRHLVIITKGGHPAFTPGYPRPERYLAPEVVHSEITESLERLNIPQLDLFLLHRDDRRVPVGEIIDMLNDEVADGRIRYFGASNWRTDRIDAANDYAAKKGAMGMVASEPQFSLAHPNAAPSDDDSACRFLTPADLTWHEAHQFPAFCYSPTAQGYFASAGKAAATTYENPTSRARLERAESLAKKFRVTANQIALAYIRAQPFPAIPILGTSKLPHLQDALAAAAITLTADDVHLLINPQ